MVSQEKLMSRSTLTSSLANYSAENVTMNVATSWEAAVAKLDQEIDAIIIDESMRTAVNSQEMSELYQNKNLVVATIGIPTSATEEMLNFSALDPQWVPSENDTNDTTQDYAVYAFQSVGNPLEKELFFSSGALNNDEIRTTLDIKEPLSIYFSKSADKLTEQSLHHMMTRIQIEIDTLHTPVEAEPTAIGMSQQNNHYFPESIILFCIIAFLLISAFLFPQFSSHLKYFFILGALFASVLPIYALTGFNYSVDMNYYGAKARVWSISSGADYYEKRKTESSITMYYLAVETVVWGSCVPASSCPPNGWTQKNNAKNTPGTKSIVYNGKTTLETTTTGSFYYGIGASRHDAQMSGSPLKTQYMTEYGASWGSGCFTNGPRATAWNYDNPDHRRQAEPPSGRYPAGENFATYWPWGVECP